MTKVEVDPISIPSGRYVARGDVITDQASKSGIWLDYRRQPVIFALLSELEIGAGEIENLFESEELFETAESIEREGFGAEIMVAFLDGGFKEFEGGANQICRLP